MKKTFNYYIAAWLAVFAVFNVIVFATPNEAFGMSKFGGAFLPRYIFTAVAFVGQLLCSYRAFNADSAKNFFYNIPLITISYSALFAMLAAGSVCMAVPNLPKWLASIICLLILAFNFIAVVKESASAELVSDIDNRVAESTFSIKLLTTDAERLIGSAKTPELKAECKKVYEALRYSDPVSVPALADINTQIQNEFADFENAVNDGDFELACSISAQLISVIDKRNKSCKLLK